MTVTLIYINISLIKKKKKALKPILNVIILLDWTKKKGNLYFCIAYESNYDSINHNNKIEIETLLAL